MPRLLAAVLMVPLLSACDVHVSLEEALVYRYAEGIQSQNQSTYSEYYSNCHAGEEKKSLSTRFVEYNAVRRTGSLTFSPDGVEIIRIGALGRGAFYKVSDVSRSGDDLQFKTLLKPEYSSINFTDYPPRAVVYVLAQPFGTVLPLATGGVKGPRRQVLRSVDLAWRWTRRISSPPHWCLLSVLPLAQTATFETLQFREAGAATGPAISLRLLASVPRDHPAGHAQNWP